MEEDLSEAYDQSQEEMIQCEAEVEEELSILTNDSDSLLIELVEGYPHIYDNRNADFKDVSKKEQSWAEIAVAMNWPVPECQNRWLRLREKYARETRAMDQEIKGTITPKRRTAFALYDKMKFLKHHVKRRRTYPKIAVDNVVNSKPITKPQKMVQVHIPTLYTTNIQNQTSLPSIVTSNHHTVTLAPKPVTNSNQPAIVQIHQPALVQIIKPVQVSTMEEDTSKSTTRSGDVSSSRLSGFVIAQNSSESLDQNSDTEEKFSRANGALPSKSQDADSLFGQFVVAELRKLSEAQRKQKKQRIMQILCE